jgi:hypothetical protein
MPRRGMLPLREAQEAGEKQKMLRTRGGRTLVLIIIFILSCRCSATSKGKIRIKIRTRGKRKNKKFFVF